MALVDHTRQSATKRLMRDMKELRDSPVPNISAAPLEGDFFEWHCNVVCNDLIFHVILFIPENYPCSSPSANFFPHGIRNPAGASSRGEKGEKFCVSILSDYENYHREWKTDEGYGWSPSYTIQTVLLNITAYLSEKNIDSFSENKNLISNPELKCSDCGHTTAVPFPPLPVIQTDNPESTNTTTAHIGQQITCYVSRETFDPNHKPESCEELFGFGVDIYGPVRRPYLSTPCETLTLGSFKKMKELNGTVLSSTKETIEHFLPLCMTPVHAEFIKDEFENTLLSLTRNRRYAPRKCFSSTEEQILDCLPNLMATTVEDFCGAMEGSGDLLSGFFALHRLFLWAIDTYPTLQNIVDERIQNFLENSKNRHKRRIPDLEEWVMLLSVSSKYRWADVSQALLEEKWKRDVLENIKADCRLGDPETDTKYLLENTYNRSSKDRKRLALQVTFIRVARPDAMTLDDVKRRYDDNCGFPTADMVAEVRQGLNRSREEKTYSDWFKILNLAPPSDEDLRSEMLKAVDNAINCPGYYCNSRCSSNPWYKFLQKRKSQAKKKAKRQPVADDGIDDGSTEHRCERIPTVEGSDKGHCSKENGGIGVPSAMDIEENSTRNSSNFSQNAEPMDTGESDSALNGETLSADSIKPLLRPQLSLNCLAVLKRKRTSEIFNSDSPLGRPKRIKSCAVF